MMPNTAANERCICTGGSGVMRGNTTTIHTIGQGAGQCDKPTKHVGCDERRQHAESRRESGGKTPGKTNQTRGVW